MCKMDDDDDRAPDWPSLPGLAIESTSKLDRAPDWSSLPGLAIESTAKLLNAVDHVRFRSVCSQWRRHTQERHKAPLAILIDRDNEDHTKSTVKLLSAVDHVRFRSVCLQWHRHTQERQKAPLAILIDRDNEDHTKSTAKLLSAVDHVRFRSVCLQWHRHTQERQKAPLVILIDRDDEDHTIKAFSFLDIIRKAIIPLRPLASENVANSYYLGSSRGWIFVGTYTAAQNGNQDQLRIKLLNPFTDDIINLPILSNHPRGRVFLLDSPRNLQNNKELTVVYYLDTDNMGHPDAQVNFIQLGRENQWVTFWLNKLPNDVIALEGRLYANFLGLLEVINLETQQLVDFNLILPGLLPIQSSDPALFLRFFEDLHGRLHILFTTSYRTSSYCFKKVSVGPLEPLGLFFYDPPVNLGPAPRILHISEDFNVVSLYWQDNVHVDDYYPFRLLRRLSRFWNDGQNRWEPVGWITPGLL
ncbi:F-box domain-containing protein [Dioscorea alata]|uniref:F-box domain-containing protein n=1 Tax=Dioscorea alata TaxID=55571 RepID=A0ACB7UE97_DIOAL|nr:F-box domain-containing protein [Dioscorea alata]